METKSYLYKPNPLFGPVSTQVAEESKIPCIKRATFLPSFGGDFGPPEIRCDSRI